MKVRGAVLREIPGKLEIDDVELGTPGPREVLIRTVAAGLCHSDLHFMEGAYTCPLPAVLGHESAGVVEAVGDQVTYVRPGDHVITCLSVYCGNCEHCLTGHLSRCEDKAAVRRAKGAPPRVAVDGAPAYQFFELSSFAEAMLVHEHAIVKIDPEMPLDRAALIGCSVMTGVGAVFHTAGVRAGETVAVIGAGGVGLNAIQGAAIAGAGRVIAVDRVASKLALATRFGATHTVDASEGDAVQQVKELTGGGVHHAIEAIGLKATAEQAFAMLRRGGTATVVGMIPLGQTVEVPGHELLYEKKLQGSNMGSNRFRVDMPRLVSLYLDGRLKLDELVSRTISLDEVNDGFDAMKTGEVARSVIAFQLTDGRRWLLPALAAAVCLPLLVAVVAVANDDWHPTGDMAQAELHVRGFVEHPPLVGAAGRLGPIGQQGSHPGPAMWALLLPTYRLLGSSGFALQVGVAVVAAATAVGCLVLARRRGGDALLVVVALALALLIRANGPEVFTEPWNPWLPVLPFLAFVLLVWSVLDDDRAALPWVLGVGSFCVQCHIGYAPLVGALGLVAVVAAARRRWWRPLLLGAAVAVVLWLPPVLEQLGASGDHPGNLLILWRHFTGEHGAVFGFGEAARIAAGELSVAGGWLWGSGRHPWWPFLLVGAAWAVAVVRARQADDRAALRLHAVLAGAWVVGVVAISRIFGETFDYTYRWAWILAALVAVGVAWPLAGGERVRQVLTGAVAAVSLVGAVQAVDVESSGPRNSRIVAALGPEIVEQLDAIDPDGRYLVRWEDTVSLNATGVGVLLDLERRGFSVGADPIERAAVLPSRVLAESEATAVLRVVVGPGTRFAEGEEIASFDPRSDEEAERSRSLAADVDRELARLGLDELVPVLDQALVGVALDPRVPPEVQAKVEELIDLGLPAHVFLDEPL